MTSGDELQVLLVTPTGCDARLIAEVLRTADVASESLEDVPQAVRAAHARDIGALLIAGEALDSKGMDLLISSLKEQPMWSALPVLVLTTGGRETFRTRLQERRLLGLGNATLLERPVRVATLVSSVKAALLNRSRQYERRDATAALRQSEKLAVVGRLASSIAHEINNPLEAVTNLLYLLDETPLNEEQRGYLATARQELARVSEIASQTLTFNRQRDVRGEASIAVLLDSVLRLYQGRLSSSKIQIERRYRNTPPLSCYPGELRQVFANLIGNAFDASKRGGRILMRERPASQPKTGQSGVRITVADTGQGMSPEVKANLFKPFKSTKGNNGNGLGLWISQGIVEKHGGAMHVRSSTKETGSGTVFSIFLPFERRSDPTRTGAGAADAFQANCA